MTNASFGRTIAAIFLVFLSAACATNSTSPGGAVPLSVPRFGNTQGWTAGKIKKPILFVAYSDNVVRMYDPNTPNPPVEGEISDGVADPYGVAVDTRGWLYVANNSSRASGITVYAPGRSKPRLKIPAPGYYGLGIDSKGDVFGADVDGFVDAYKPGAKKPYETFNNFVNPRGLAVDAKDNVWVADNGSSKVYEIAAGTKRVEDQHLEGVNIPNGLAFGADGVLYVSNLGSLSRNPNVTVYEAGSKKPTYVIRETRLLYLSSVTPRGLFFQSTGKPDVLGYRPGDKKSFSTITGTAYPRGIASSPGIQK